VKLSSILPGMTVTATVTKVCNFSLLFFENDGGGDDVC